MNNVIQLKAAAYHNIYSGDFVSLNEDGTIRAARNDVSKKARFLRWVGRLLHIYKLEQYGCDYIVGVATNMSTYDEEKGTNIVDILVNSNHP